MHRSVAPHTGQDLLALAAAEVLWAELTAGSQIPTVARAMQRGWVQPHSGYLLLGAAAVPTVKTKSGRWCVPKSDVVLAAGELSAVVVDPEDLVRVGPPGRERADAASEDWLALRWRHQVGEQWRRVRELWDLEEERERVGFYVPHLAGIDWRALLVEHGQAQEVTWWLPRAVTTVLDAAERAEAAWLLAARTCETCGAVADQAGRWRVQVRGGWTTLCPACRTRTLRPYRGELDGSRYSTNGMGRSGANLGQWLCAVCQQAPAFVLDHCHDHGLVRAPVCQPCNMMERPEQVGSNTVSAGGHLELLLEDAARWLRHWHRCTGCRARDTLPLPHLAALAASLVDPPALAGRGAGAGGGCGWRRAMWTGGPTATASCTIRVTVHHCADHADHTLAELSYSQALALVRAFIAERAPDVAAAAGPDQHTAGPVEFRPVVTDNGPGLTLF